jgi:phage tail-like protein
MDVNGTHFHLLYGRADWGACLALDAEVEPVPSLAELWALIDEAEQPPLQWNAGGGYLHLKREAPIFYNAAETERLQPDMRRGAGRDQYGHWYWIDEQESGIRFLANGERASVSFWSWADQPVDCPPAVPPGDFADAVPPTPQRLRLRGLAVTTRHYLVVGNLSQHGLLIFDLHRGGPPVLLQWPDEVPFAPWDMAPTPEGGVLILDRDNARYWALDEHFRLFAETEFVPALFQPAADEARPNLARYNAQPLGYPLEFADPLSIESGPDGHALVLFTTPGQPSIIGEYDAGERVASYLLDDVLDVADGGPADGDDSDEIAIGAHDFAYIACCVGERDDCPPCLDITAAQGGEPRQLHLLYVARGDGNQVIAFVMDRSVLESEAAEEGEHLPLQTQPDYLPLRRWQAKALVAAAGSIWYDFAGRWVPLQIFVDCRYARQGALATPLPTSFEDEQPHGQQFDSGIIGCTWHRVLLDADIPPGTAIFVRARAADDLALLSGTSWQAQPMPYLRSGGSEIPFYTTPLADEGSRQGTWELLLQGVQGRYIQLELTLQGSGRSTPRLYALRVWFPRFSYLDHYLPAIYREDPVPASFLERWLANYEGLYTNLEDKIEHMPRLLDPRTAPAETLGWLAGWFGVALDPLWTEERRRFFLRHAYELYSRRGTVPGIEIGLRLYLDDEVGEWLFDPACWGTSNVRIVERFLTRNTNPRVYGDTAPTTTTAADEPAASAHRFVVLLPHGLTPEEYEMAQRIIDLEKPAHTAFELTRYWNMFRVGEARLGQDTQLGEASLIGPLQLGADALADAYLQAPYPFNVRNRLISDRDRLGDAPGL